MFQNNNIHTTVADRYRRVDLTARAIVDFESLYGPIPVPALIEMISDSGLPGNSLDYIEENGDVVIRITRSPHPTFVWTG